MSNKLSERVFVDPGLLKMNDALGKFDVGTITAFRPGFTYGQNRERNKQLLAFFLNKRYTIALIKGSYIEDMKSANSVVVTEESFFISDERKLGVLLTDLRKLGTHFDQDSILFKPANDFAMLYGLSDRPTAYPKRDRVVKLGSASKVKVSGEFFTRISAKSFVFESIDDLEYPGTINGIRGLKIAAASLGF